MDVQVKLQNSNTNSKAVPNNAAAFFEKFSSKVTYLTGRPVAFLSAFALVLVWAAFGPVFHYSENWQLVINTGTTIITFLMVFLIQNTQNRDGAAIQTKLDELIRGSKGARNKLVNLENCTVEEIAAYER